MPSGTQTPRSIRDLPLQASRELTGLVLAVLAAPPLSREQDLASRALALCALRHKLTADENALVYLEIKRAADGELRGPSECEAAQ